MNVSPVSFGKIVKVDDRKSNAYNLASLTNGNFIYPQYACLQNEAKKIFNDVTPKGPATVITRNGGEDVFIVSGKDTEKAAKIFGKGKEISTCSRPVGEKETEFGIVVKELDKEADKAMARLLKKGQAPFEIKVCGKCANPHLIKTDKQVDINA